MNKKLYLLVVFISNVGFCQKFDFNLVTNYTIIQNGISTDRMAFSNTENQQYFLSIKNNSENNEAYLVDLKNDKIHSLSFTKEIINGETSFEFSYVKTKPMEEIALTKNYNYEFETIQEDSLYKTIRMTCVKNKKKKNISKNQYSIIKVKKHTNNLFPLFRFSYMHLFEYREDIDMNENGIVESVESFGDPKVKAKLSYIKEVNFNINIPN